MEIPVRMSGGRTVAAFVGGHEIVTDQPVEQGGNDSAPAPSDLFLASLATCAAYYVLNFCLERKIPADDVSVVMRTHKKEDSSLLDRIELDIKIPPDFPEKYEKAVVRAANLCWVKKVVQSPPKFETYTSR